MIISYHDIVEKPSQYVYGITSEQMKQHFACLLKRKDSGLSEVGITFDDGLAAQYSPAADLLEDVHLRGVFFINPANIGQQRYMDVSQIRDLAARGHEIQSHGWSHKLLPLCERTELRMELSRSKNTLENWLGRKVRSLAVPGGGYNNAVLCAAAEAGYSRVYASDPWLGPVRRQGVLLIGRLMVRNNMTPDRLTQILDTGGRRICVPRLGYISRQAARRVLGISLYHRLWMVAARYPHAE